MSKEELINSIDELENKLSKLNLKDNLTKEELEKFYEVLMIRLKKYDYEIELDHFYTFAKSFKLSDLEIINFIKVNPSVLTKIGFNEFLKKYIFLSVVENEMNTQRLRHMKKTPRDYQPSLDKLYSKYFYMKENGLDINWSTLMRQKYERLDKKVIGAGGLPLSIEKVKEKYPVDDKYIDELKLLAINNLGEFNDKRTKTR